MGKQVHFVVVADLDSETWWVDEELTYARFDKDTTWNEDESDWEATTSEDYLKSLQILNKGRES
jgi:hypothetical protein